jgi:hypothetical protein
MTQHEKCKMYIRAYDFKPPTATDELSDFTVRSLEVQIGS